MCVYVLYVCMMYVCCMCVYANYSPMVVCISKLSCFLSLLVAPRLDVSKSLKEQYNFSIKPFLLHLRYVS